MINHQKLTSVAVWFRGQPHYPVNICLHCGVEDDPESQWEFDDDDDRVCLECYARYERKVARSRTQPRAYWDDGELQPPS